MKKLPILIFIILAYLSCSKSHNIEQKPIQFDSTRTALSLQYLEEHYGIQQQTPTITPQMVVVHWTAIPTFKKTFEVFDPPTLRNTRPDIKGAGVLNVSAHYLIKRNGDIFQLLPDTIMARHTIGLNHTAIGIENVGSQSQRLTAAQLEANAWLIRKLANKHPVKYLIGHHEYTLFEEHALWKERDEGYRTDKIDPGESFMEKLRHKVHALGLKGPPAVTQIHRIP
ncbi:N-acetylmuramoyl-L-alanine amidase [Fodinibius salsisoli]|uniref:N-acetylmuramoyl-L-alanine amidase n=1 Tax=Fodinibius salsisoli TaxID=2820877 RepID=A0ABT3PRQ8_9BACT|nr:peptidoglycan recognition family protein [Fodinibius salsisoli]MCW9708545.1 N-acetylmuramoyl-L-alanine amidase [Fodinibius salsisoli]